MSNTLFNLETAEMRKQKYADRLEMLKSGERDVYLFGAGVYAKRIQEYFDTKGISIKGYVVDDEYASKASGDVLALSDVIKNDNMILVYAMGGGFSNSYFEKTEQIKKRVDECSNSEFYIPSDFWMEDMGYTTHEYVYLDYIKEHLDEFMKTYDLLEDELSKDIMTEYLYAASGNDATGLAALGTAPESDYDLDILFSGLQDGVVIECGAFDGKSVVQMSDYTDNRFEMIAMECDEDNYKICCDKVEGYSNIEVLKYGVWDKKTKLAMVQSADASYLVEVKDDKDYDIVVEVVDIDSVAGSRKVAAVVMDIEGSELKALQGAKNVIENGANLAVRIYHKKEDLITIPQFIKSLNDSYKFYIRFNRGANQCRTGDETTLYAICGK